MKKSNPIIEAFSAWMQRNFSDPGALSLFFTLIFVLLFIEFFGGFFMPVIVAIVMAYLLLPAVHLLEKWKLPHWLAVLLVFVLFVGLVVFVLVMLLPELWKQLMNLVNELPQALNQGQTWLNHFMAKYPKVISEADLVKVSVFLKEQSAKMGQYLLRFSIVGITNMITVVIYFILVPLLIFFFLKDSQAITAWFGQYMPKNRGLALQVWSEVNTKIGSYIKGRVLEVIIVTIVSWIAFAFLGLQYSFLLAAILGLSVIIPYVGAVVATIPIMIVSLMQWGWSTHFLYLVIAFTLIIALDANLLAPLLFAEAMDLHPIVIILSVVIFGGVWGFWGVFFAIPLATLVNAVLKAWPRNEKPATDAETN